MYGRVQDVPDALAVRSGFLSRHRRLVPAETIVEIDSRSRVIGLGVEREAIRSFLSRAWGTSLGALFRQALLLGLRPMQLGYHELRRAAAEDLDQRLDALGVELRPGRGV